MPVLLNARHELFAQNLFKGLSAAAAFEMSGYAKNYGNASRLKGSEKVRARVAELHSEAAAKTIDAIAFDAKSLFARLEEQIQEARQAGQLKVAMDGRLAMLEAFGYRDSPTMTHEHIAGRRIDTQPVPLQAAGEGTVTYLPPPERRFAQIMAKLRRKMNE